MKCAGHHPRFIAARHQEYCTIQCTNNVWLISYRELFRLCWGYSVLVYSYIFKYWAYIHASDRSKRSHLSCNSHNRSTEIDHMFSIVQMKLIIYSSLSTELDHLFIYSSDLFKWNIIIHSIVTGPCLYQGIWSGNVMSRCRESCVPMQGPAAWQVQ